MTVFGEPGLSPTSPSNGWPGLVSRREFLATALLSPTVRPVAANSLPILNPEMFGARGDGVTNDTSAFLRLSASVNAAGGGTVLLGRGRTYVVGDQRPGAAHGYLASPILEFRNLTRPFALYGNGARLVALKGLRYGSFDPRTGRAALRPLPNTDETLKVSPYRAMVLLSGCTARLTVRDLELDGNLTALSVGGRWGDGGWQVPGTGLCLVDNAAEEVVDNVFSHHQPLDGVLISGRVDRLARSRLTRLRCWMNGRQGLSFTGGRQYDFINCDFASTGCSSLSSPPGAGVDLEAEDNKTIRDLSFRSCRFRDNVGAGLGSDAGNVANVSFSDCEFVGSRNWSAWPRGPGFTFERCTFAGALVHAFPSADPSKAARFLDCHFTDDPSLSSTGQLYFSGGPAGAVVDLDDSRNVLFDGCVFILKRNGVLPWTSRALYHNCHMQQRSATVAMTRGKYLGRTTIDGPVSLYGSMIAGDVVLNGKTIPKGPVGSDFKPW